MEDSKVLANDILKVFLFIKPIFCLPIKLITLARLHNDIMGRRVLIVYTITITVMKYKYTKSPQPSIESLSEKMHCEFINLK